MVYILYFILLVLGSRVSLCIYSCKLYIPITKFNTSDQIEALKDVGVTEVVLAINYQPEVIKKDKSSFFGA